MHSPMCYRWIIAIDVVDVVVASEEEPAGARRGEIGRRSRSDGQSNALVFHASNATQTSTGTGACALLQTETVTPHNSSPCFVYSEKQVLVAIHRLMTAMMTMMLTRHKLVRSRSDDVKCKLAIFDTN